MPNSPSPTGIAAALTDRTDDRPVYVIGGGPGGLAAAAAAHPLADAVAALALRDPVLGHGPHTYATFAVLSPSARTPPAPPPPAPPRPPPPARPAPRPLPALAVRPSLPTPAHPAPPAP
ncbi:hypothetical protein, partial [Streptomyces griseus]|uniref:hypothetical protein n=1 Tax=Streptomyces griseus TaxID=1911 RepID=UPI001C5A4200